MPTWIIAALGAAGAFALSLLLHTVDVDRIERAQETAITAQQATDKKSCDSDKAITKEANDAFIKTHNYSDDQCATALSMPAKCVPVQPAQRAIMAKPRPKPAAAYGLSATWLHAYAIQCEAIRQDYITAVGFGHACATGQTVGEAK